MSDLLMNQLVLQSFFKDHWTIAILLMQVIAIFFAGEIRSPSRMTSLAFRDVYSSPRALSKCGFLENPSCLRGPGAVTLSSQGYCIGSCLNGFRPQGVSVSLFGPFVHSMNCDRATPTQPILSKSKGNENLRHRHDGNRVSLLTTQQPGSYWTLFIIIYTIFHLQQAKANWQLTNWVF